MGPAVLLFFLCSATAVACAWSRALSFGLALSPRVAVLLVSYCLFMCPTAFHVSYCHFMCPTAFAWVLLPFHVSYYLFMGPNLVLLPLHVSYCLFMGPTAFSWVLLPLRGSYCLFMCPTAFHWSYFLCMDPTAFAWLLLLSFVLLQLLPVPGPLAYSSHGVWRVAVLLVSYCLFIVSYCFFHLCPTAFVRILLLLTVSYCFFSVSCC